MKKITFTLFTFLLFFVKINSQEVLNETFDSDLSLPTGWTNESSGVAQSELWTFTNDPDFLWLFTAGNGFMEQYAGGSGNNALFDSNSYAGAEMVDSSLTSPVFDCSNLTEIKLSYGYFILISAIGYNGSGFVEVFDGTTWIAVAEYSEATVAVDANGYYWDYGEALIDVTEQLAGVSNAQVRFRFSEATAQAWGWKIDNVILQQPQGNPPETVLEMIPVDGAIDVEIMLSENNTKMIDFNFTPSNDGDAATSFDFWFGTSATTVSEAVAGVLPDVDIIWGTTALEGWQPNTTYYWAIEANNVAGSTLSNIQSFTTGANDPLSVRDPLVKNFKVYPNPVKDILFIEGNTPIEQVEIINQIGQNMLEIKNSATNSELDLTKLSAGIYFVKLTSDSKSEIHQIIKK